jgi:hypothetical protein
MMAQQVCNPCHVIQFLITHACPEVDMSAKELRDLANAEALVRRAVKIIEDLLPGFPKTTADLGEINDWLLASREYNASTPADRVRERRWSRDAMACPNCKEIELVPQIGSDEMWECMSCHCEVML